MRRNSSFLAIVTVTHTQSVVAQTSSLTQETQQQQQHAKLHRLRMATEPPLSNSDSNSWLHTIEPPRVRTVRRGWNALPEEEKRRRSASKPGQVQRRALEETKARVECLRLSGQQEPPESRVRIRDDSSSLFLISAG